MVALLPGDAYYALLEIFIFLAFAEVLHSLGARFGLPQIVADLFAGIALSTFALGGILNGLLRIPLFTVNSYVLFFAIFSVVLVLFSAGLEGGFSSLRDAGFVAAAAAVAGDLASFALAFVVFSRLVPLPAALLLSVATAATSTAVVANLLRTEAAGGTLGGKFLLNVAALDDVVALVLLSIVLTTLGGHLDVIVVTGSAVEAVVAWVVLLLASVLVVPRLFRVRSLQAYRDLPFTILFVLVAIVVALGFSAVIGAYIAGLAVAESLVATRTREITAVLTAIFGSLFFVVIGAEFNIGLLTDPRLLLYGLLLAGLACGAKFGGVYPFARVRLGNASDALTVAVGMIPRGEIGLLVGAIGLSTGVLTPPLFGVLVLMAITTTLLGAVLFRRRLVRAVAAEEPSPAPVAEPAS